MIIIVVTRLLHVMLLVMVDWVLASRHAAKVISIASQTALFLIACFAVQRRAPIRKSCFPPLCALLTAVAVQEAL